MATKKTRAPRAAAGDEIEQPGAGEVIDGVPEPQTGGARASAASGSSESSARRAQPQVILTGDQAARMQIAEEMAALRKAPLDKATRPGGYFVGADGESHDAHGNKIAEK